MLRSKTSLASALVLLSFSCPLMLAQSSTPQEEKNKDLVLNWWREVIAFYHVDLAPKYMADDYVETRTF